MSTSVMLE